MYPRKIIQVKKATCSILLVSMLALPFTSIQADMIDTRDVVAQEQQQTQGDRLHELLKREEITSWLQTQGVSPEDASKRIDNLTPEELSEFQAQLDQLPAGEGFLGSVIAIIVIFMLLDIAGVTDIFPGI